MRATSSVTGKIGGPGPAHHGRLAVDGGAVVAASLDPFGGQDGGELVGPLVPRHVQVVHVLGAGCRHRRHETGQVADPVDVVGGGGLPTCLVPRIQMGKQHPEHRCLQGVEPGVVANLGEGHLVLRAVEAQAPRRCRHVVIVGRDRTAIAQASQILGGEKRKRCGVAQRARPGLAQTCAGRLRGVLEHRNAQFPQVRDGCDVAEQVDGHHGLRPPGHRRLDARARNAEAGGIDIAEHRHRPGCHHSLSGRVEGEGRDHDFVTGLHAQRSQRNRQCLRAVCHPDAVTHAQMRRELLLEGLDLGAQDETARVHHACHGLEHGLAVRSQ